MRLRPEDIHEKQFKITFRGLDPMEVDNFLKRAGDELERVIEEKVELEKRLAEESAARNEMQKGLSAARTLQQEMLEKAREDAHTTVEHAKSLSEKIMEESKEELLSIRRQVKELEKKRAKIMAEMDQLYKSFGQWVEANRVFIPSGEEAAIDPDMRETFEPVKASTPIPASSKFAAESAEEEPEEKLEEEPVPAASPEEKAVEAPAEAPEPAEEAEAFPRRKIQADQSEYAPEEESVGLAEGLTDDEEEAFPEEEAPEEELQAEAPEEAEEAVPQPEEVDPPEEFQSDADDADETPSEAEEAEGALEENPVAAETTEETAEETAEAPALEAETEQAGDAAEPQVADVIRLDSDFPRKKISEPGADSLERAEDSGEESPTAPEEKDFPRRKITELATAGVDHEPADPDEETAGDFGDAAETEPASAGETPERQYGEEAESAPAPGDSGEGRAETGLEFFPRRKVDGPPGESSYDSGDAGDDKGGYDNAAEPPSPAQEEEEAAQSVEESSIEIDLETLGDEDYGEDDVSAYFDEVDEADEIDNALETLSSVRAGEPEDETGQAEPDQLVIRYPQKDEDEEVGPEAAGDEAALETSGEDDLQAPIKFPRKPGAAQLDEDTIIVPEEEEEEPVNIEFFPKSPEDDQ